MKKEKRFSIRMKMYIFVIITVLLVAFGTSVIAYTTMADQIDRYYMQNTADNARNFASMVDGDFLEELKTVAASEEFQELREIAEETDDESLIENYLTEKGLWEKYSETRDKIQDYLDNMEGIKYLYIVAHGDIDAEYDMYLVDDKENPIYETGYYEEREKELRGVDLTQLPETTISNGDWGWLCSDFKPVYNSEGKCVCIVGCDIGMDDVMTERQRILILLLAGAIVFTMIILAGAMNFINKVVVKPLDQMTKEMKKFNPTENLSYDNAGVMNIDIRSHDEISEIYQGIRTMQMNIIDFLKNLLVLQEDKMRAENDIKDKEKQIGQLSAETYKDSLTGVGNKAAYVKKLAEINEQIEAEGLEFAIVMIDMNSLKRINDEFGHKAGDNYISGCCHIICEAFKHSPVYRIGGDEFVVILQGQDYENRKEIVEELKNEYVKSYEQEDTDPWLRYSAAVGMAENASDDYTAELVFKRADKAMYKDKANFKAKYGIESRR